MIRFKSKDLPKTNKLRLVFLEKILLWKNKSKLKWTFISFNKYLKKIFLL